MSSASWSGYAGLMGTLVLIVIMTTALVVLINKSFAMIYETADNVMKWIGGGVSGAGEFRGTSEVQGAMGGAVGQTRGALQQGLTQLATPGRPGNGAGKMKEADAADGGGKGDKQNKQNTDLELGSVTAKDGGAGQGSGASSEHEQGNKIRF